MEKQVNEKAHDLAADHVKHNHAHLGDPNRDLEHGKDHKDEMLDKEGKEILMTHEPHHDGNNGAGHQCEEIPLSPEKHACNETDVSTTRPSSETKDTHVNLALGDEDAKAMQVHTGMPATHEKQEHNVEHAPGKLAVYEKQEHDVEHAPIITQDPPENTSPGVPTSHNEHADTVYESNEIQVPHGSVAHDHEVLAVTHEQMEKATEHENATHDDEHVGQVSLDHESGESHTTHEKTIDGDKYTGVVHEAGQMHTAHEKHAYNAQNSEGTTPEKLTHVHTDPDKTLNAKHMHNEDTEHNLGDKPSKHDDDADVALKHGQAHKCNVVIARASQEHGEKCRIEDDECESKKELADENSLKERVHFSRGSTPDVDTPTQQTSSPFSNTKSSKSGSKGAGNAERGPGSTDGNPETPSTSWAFSARASIAPSKFDHMATLRLTYGAYRESNRGKEGVPLSLTQCCKTK